VFVIHVQAQVKPPYVEAFKKACIENAKESIKEEGIVRFDIVQQQDDPTRFVLVEIYRNKDVPSKHKETVHYKDWRDKVLPMMAQPRKSIFYTNIYPDDKNWV
jgi:(4S)-4-hydroxy-5-phosphonooxypentane-2,3-dione isomerase